MPRLVVCPLNRAQSLIGEHKASHVVSLLGPDTPHRSFTGVAQDQHLKLTFHDVVQPLEGFTAPRSADAERLLRFLDQWDRASPMLIHCWAGISRSTAAAYTAMCLYDPKADEEELAFQLREASPSATPNRLIVSLVDAALGRQGRMMRAIEKIGRGEDAFEGTPFLIEIGKPVSAA